MPPATELHATKFVNGRDRISTAGNDDSTEWKTLGRAVTVECLAVLRDCPDIKIGAVWRRTTATGRDYYDERAEVYNALVERWNAEHRAAGSYAFVSMDGNGSDPTYFDAHRALPLDTRHEQDGHSGVGRLRSRISFAQQCYESRGCRWWSGGTLGLNQQEPLVHECGAGPLEQDVLRPPTCQDGTALGRRRLRGLLLSQLPVLVITPAYSWFVLGRIIPSGCCCSRAP